MTKAEKILVKSKFRDIYRSMGIPIREAILREYVVLLNENEPMDKKSEIHMEKAILPAIAIYRVLPQKGYSETDVRRMIRKSILDGAKPMTRLFQALGKLPYFFSLFRIMCPLSMKGDYGGIGWDFEWKRNDKFAIEWECHSCLYVNCLTSYGMRELAPIFCESDDVMYGNIKNARWARRNTIGRGAELCDFTFYNTKKEGVRNEKNK